MDAELEEALKVLGIPADSDRTRVTEAYRRLARATHPDVSSDPDAAERFDAASAAYRLVSALARPGARSAGAPGPQGMQRTERASWQPVPRPPSPGAPEPVRLGDDRVRRSVDAAGFPIRFAVSPPLREGCGGRPPIVAGPVLVRPARHAGSGEA
jgi:hypothetical protein